MSNVPKAPLDTDPAALRMLDEAYARMSPSDKLRRLAELSRMVNELALAGLRSRHPELTEEELLLRLAEMRLGPELVRTVYGIEDP